MASGAAGSPELLVPRCPGRVSRCSGSTSATAGVGASVCVAPRSSDGGERVAAPRRLTGVRFGHVLFPIFYRTGDAQATDPRLAWRAVGVLTDVESSSFLLPTENFAMALAAVRTLAEERPSEFFHPERVVAATGLPEVLHAATWAFEQNDAGDIVKLWFGADKAPRNSDECFPEALLRALAPAVRYGVVTLELDGTKIFDFVFDDGHLNTDGLFDAIWEAD